MLPLTMLTCKDDTINERKGKLYNTADAVGNFKEITKNKRHEGFMRGKLVEHDNT